MKNLNKEIATLAVMVMLLSGCATQHVNTVVKVGANNKIWVKDSETNVERIITVTSTDENKEALKYACDSDVVNISGKNYDKDLVMDKATVLFNADTTYARHQRELFNAAKVKYFRVK